MTSGRWRTRRGSVAAAVLLPVLVAFPAHAGPAGSMDPSFGEDGVVTRHLGGLDIVNAVAVQPDGKVLALVDQTKVLRFTAEGLPDPTFGDDGVSPVPTSPAVPYARASDLALAPDGRILLGGVFSYDGIAYAAAFALNPNGTPDAWFGGQGRAGAAVGAVADAVAATADGGVAIAGIGTVEGVKGAYVVRFTRSGAFDARFGGDGRAVVEQGPFATLGGLALQPADEKPVLVSHVDTGYGNGEQQDVKVVRFAADGAPDPGFGFGGQVTLSLGGREQSDDVLALPSGRIVVSASTETTSGDRDSDSVLAAYTSQGLPDPGFGKVGLVQETGEAFESPRGLAVDRAGRLSTVVAGYPAEFNSFDHHVRRYTFDGRRDLSFGIGGEAVADFVGLSDESVNDLAVAPAGEIVYGGRAMYGSNGDAGLGRMLADTEGGVDLGPITDDESPTISVSDVTVVEGDSGTQDAVLPVALSQTSARTITVAYATEDGSARAGTDYTPTIGNLTFAPGETRKTVEVPVAGDTTPEADETFVLTLSNPTGGAGLGDDEGTAVITDDDASGTPIPAARLIDDACPPDQVPPNSRQDDDGNTHEFAIDCMVWWEIGKGTSTTDWDPEVPVTRDRMATFIVALIQRSGREMPAGPDAFIDDNGNFHEPSINKLAAAGIVTGDGNGRYKAGNTVTRAQMAKFLVLAYEWRSGRTIAASADYFQDDNGTTLEEFINKAASSGFTSGRPDGRYVPDGLVQRDAMASFLARPLDLLVEEGTTASR